MTTKRDKTIATLLTLALAAAGFAFWMTVHPEALSFAEEMQMFLFNGGYALEKISVPGGVAAFSGEFLTQFFSLLWLGAVVQSALLVALQLVSYRLSRLTGGGAAESFALSFAPAVAMVAVMGDPNVTVSYALSVLAGLGACSLVARAGGSDKAAIVMVGVGIPTLFFACGPATYALAAYAVVGAVRRWGASLRSASWVAGIAVYTILTVVATYRLSAYPLGSVAAGLGTYRQAEIPAWPAGMACAFGLWPFVASRVRMIARRRRVALCGIAAATVAGGVAAGLLAYDGLTYRIMRYDLCLRRHDWAGALSIAEREAPRAPLELATVNFALVMRGELADRMFEYPQVSSEGLIPLFSREVASAMMTSDIYMELGMVNTARRFAFEAQEAIPDQRKSGRLTKRLAEVAITDGQYALASRYLDVLSQTFAYGRWAGEMKTLIKDETKVAAHPYFSKLRRRRISHDFFYSDREMDQMLGLLFSHDKSNRMALDYLLCLELQTRDMGSFIRYAPLLGQLPDGGRFVPRHYQEAMCMAWAQRHNSFDGMTWPVANSVKRQFAEFAKIHSADKHSPLLSEGRLGSSYWAFFVDDKKDTDR